MFKKITNWYKKHKYKKYHDKVCSTYYNFATNMGDGISYAYVGEPISYYHDTPLDLAEQFELLDKLEERYSLLGYRIVPLDSWVAHGGYGAPIDDEWQVKREDGERPRFTKGQTNADVINEDFKKVRILFKETIRLGRPIRAYVDEFGDEKYEFLE